MLDAWAALIGWIALKKKTEEIKRKAETLCACGQQYDKYSVVIKQKQKQKAQMRGKTQTILSALTTSAKTTIIYYV